MAEPHSLEAALSRFIVGADGAPVAPPRDGVGAPAPRADGRDKVSGAARFAGEAAPRGVLQAVLVGSPVARGRLTDLDPRPALALPGVVRVITGADMPPLGPAMVPPVAQSYTPMTDAAIHYEGQPVAMVLAETLEAAEAGAAAVILRVERAEPTVFETAQARAARVEGNGYAFARPDVDRGDVAAGLAAAAVRVEAEYLAPTRHHNMMEPSTTLAEWRGDDLHIQDATQWTYGVRYALAGLLGVDLARIHVSCPYTGGGFGAKGYVWPHQVLAPIAARLTGLPVKLSLGRAGCYTGCGYQPAVWSRVELGADAEGRLTALVHETENLSSRMDDYLEFGSAGSRGLYACPAARFRTRIRPADVGTPTAMRAPHEGPGMFATESAMDELAVALDIDPLELRLRNHADLDPDSGKPFSSNKLREAYAEGARRFGWAERPRAPRSLRDGDLLIGWGMAAAIMTTFRFASTARCVAFDDGTVEVRVGSQEIGTGTRTILAQVAAERLGLPTARVRVTLGDASLPETGGTFGSSTTISAGSAVADAADRLRERLAEVAGAPGDWAAALAARGIGSMHADGGFALPGGAVFDAHGGAGAHAMHTWGAVFVEMAVDEALGQARMRRAVACYSAGRILNPVTARSQMIGGVIWGYGRAMLEESRMDAGSGRFLSKNLSGAALPTNADIPRDIDVSFIDEHDPHASLIGARGIGELGEVGVAAAITNALHHATGRRIRTLPVRAEDLLA
jgi:xanthine dehydrogenase YagR molybdenum-binding subunit